MAAVIIPGLTIPLGPNDFKETNRLYNTLAEVDDQPEVSSRHLQALHDLYNKYDVQELLGIHLIHGHCQIGDDKIMLGMKITNPLPGYWSKPVKIDEVDPSKVHGHIFKLVDSTRFVAYEFTEGSVTDMSSLPPKFIQELTNYICDEGLFDTLALEVLGDRARSMVEFDFTELGTVMLKDDDVARGNVTHVTGWVFCRDENGITSYKGDTCHAPTTKGPHKVFINGKSGLDLDRLGAVIRQYGIV